MRCLNGRRTGLLLATLVVTILALAGPADAQVLYGSIVGDVVDTSGAAVPGATVTAINQGTNLAREATTGAAGAYSFSNLQEGTYTIRVSLQGFKEYVEEGIPVTQGGIARVNVALEVGALTEVITVQSEQALLQTDSGDLKGTLDAAEIENLPLGNYRNYQKLLDLVPGTTPAGFQNAITDTPERSLTTNVNGLNRNNNNTRLDGATNVYIWLPHHALYVAPSETVETVNISTASFDAEQGMAGGSAISVATKSGTNEFHGSGTFLFENDSLRARNWANTSGDKPSNDRKIGAATLGGPIIKDKLFFFAGWEGHYTKTPNTRTGTLPTAAMRAGDFSAFGTTIYDPLTGDPNTGEGRTPFPNNIIPAGRIDPIAAQLQALLPAPNADGVTSNYTDSGLTTFDRNNYDVKINFNVSNSFQIFGKYSRMDANVYSDMWLGNPNASGTSGAGSSGWGDGSGDGDTKVQIGTLGATWTVSPTFLVDMTLATSRFDQECIPPDFGVQYGSDIFGIPGTNADSPGRSDEFAIRYSGLPSIGVSNYTSWGGVDGWTPAFRNDRSYNFSINSSWIKNNHDLRFGFDVVKLELNHWQPELGNPRGSINFGGGVTTQGGVGSPDQFNSYAQFLLGYISDANKSIQAELNTGREWQLGLYVRDRWQVNRNLTLNLGLRFEHYPLMTRENRGLEVYDENTNQVLLGGLGGNPEDLGLEPEYPRILPRVGFAYRIGEDNVIRGGYGITVSPMPFSRPLRGFYPSVPANSFVAPNSYVPIGTLAEGIPLFTRPDISGGSVPLPLQADMRSPGTAGDNKVRRGYIQSWNLLYERRLPWDASVSFGYVGTKTTDALGFWNFNYAGPGEGADGQLLYQRFGRTGGTYRFDGMFKTAYHSLQVAFNKPFSNGLFLKAAYTWSKAMNEADDAGWATVNWNSPEVMFRNFALAGYDRAHMFQAGFVWEVPFGRDGDGALNAIVRDWSINGIFSAFTGTPFTVSASGDSLNARANSQTADLVGEINQLGGIGSDNPYYDTSAWAPITEVRYGNTGRNTVRGPGWWNIDMGIFRKFPLGDRVNLELRAEAFNLTNTPHFNNPNGSVNSGSFMTITGTSSNSPERQFRLGGRITF
ncbi:MAG: TonB-dependent receptor [Acidobacteria bacterium]|nr:TonB-dependent receptor [Acidobacteriota bacterium]